MRTRSGGLIVNSASTAGFETTLPDRAAYAASKAGVVGFGRECAREFAGYGIRVTTILPDETDASSAEQVASDVLTLCTHPAAQTIDLENVRAIH